ncbi:unnamed protein product [Blepharisma stoltei]|uniref:Uncharacterized protein n=1 Tax=Blepharisma stoltei TaxID=1481888 RepID=A0AAU9JGQ7_9CILI|nr:unnamed protein product [Blepharisma stoltei]
MKYLVIFICLSLALAIPSSAHASIKEFEKICSDPKSQKCVFYLITKAIELANFKGSENLLGSGFQDFFYGIYLGIQENPISPGFCVNSFTPLSYSYSQLRQSIISIFTELNLNYLFAAITNFNYYNNKLVNSWDLCGGNYLSTILPNLFTEDGFGNLIVNFGASYAQIIENWEKLVENAGNNNYINAGAACGEILSDLLDFSI